MRIIDYILFAYYLLFIVFLIVNVKNFNKAKEKVIISKLNKKRAVIVGIAYLMFIAFSIAFWIIFGFDMDLVHDLIIPALFLGTNFKCVTPNGIIGDAIKNNGLVPSDNYSYRYTFTGAFQTECLEIYANGNKKPEKFFGNIRNHELVKMLEECYSEYTEIFS